MKHIALLIVMVLGLSWAAPAPAQNNLCPALVEEALLTVGSNCGGLGLNNACYGYTRVDATFVEEQPVDFFAGPSDRGELFAFDTIATNPLNIERSEWGIAVLNVQANLPSTLPGQAVVFLMLGDVALTNDGASEPLEPVEPVEVRVDQSVNLRSGPSTNANVLTSIPRGSSLFADRLSDDRDWLRVTFDGRSGWVNRGVVTVGDDADTLPTGDTAPRGVMQAFTLRTALTGVTCTEAPPSLLVIQGPRQTTVELTVNGVDLSLGSTVFFNANPQNGLNIGVLDGEANLEDGLTIPQGYTVNFPLDEEGQVNGPRRGFRPLTLNELNLLQPLELLPPSLLHYLITLPPPPPPPQQNTAPGSTNATPTATPEGAPTSTPTAAAPAALLPLTASTVCAGFPLEPRIFTVFNPNPVEVPVSWSASTGESAFFFAPPGGSRSVTVNVPGAFTERTAAVTFTADWGTGTSSATSDLCQPPG